MDNNDKFFPVPTAETRHYWDGCNEGELRVQQCTDCGNIQFYPRVICANCMGNNIEWISSTGMGKIVSFSIVRRAVSKAYEGDVPYVVALIELDEGPVMMTNIIQCEIEEVEIGLAVTVVFEQWSAEISVPKFKLIAKG